MSEELTPTRGRLREQVAEEIRSLTARRRWSDIELGRRIGMKQSAISRRMNGDTAFDMDDLEKIAAVLEVPVTAFFPKGKEVSQDFEQAPAAPVMTKSQGFAAPTIRVTPPPEPRRHPRPNSQTKAAATRPVSGVPARDRRPRRIGAAKRTAA